MSLTLLNASLFAAEALAASVVMALGAWLAGHLLRERAALRHLSWLTVFCTLLMLPLVAVFVPSQVMLEMAAGTLADRAADTGNVSADPSPLPGLPVIIGTFAAIWAAGFCWNLFGLVAGLHGLNRLRKTGVRFDAGIGCEVRLAPTVPLTFGWLSPVILLPLDAPQWSRVRLEAVLGHEGAHVARRDHLSNAAALLACALYWPNPLMWRGRRMMCEAAEIAADNRVLAAGMKPSVYAAELLALAADHRGRPNLAALAMAAPSWLETRVIALLSTTQSRRGVAAPESVGLACLGAAVALLLALLRPGLAEIPASAARPLMPARASATDMPFDRSLADPGNRERLSAASAPGAGSARSPGVGRFGARTADPGTQPGSLLRETGPETQDARNTSTVRMEQLAILRIERETRLREEAALRQVARDADLARVRAARELALEAGARERAARLAREKIARDAAHSAP